MQAVIAAQATIHVSPLRGGAIGGPESGIRHKSPCMQH